tara:strand:+ start:1161 stop:1262 length:102 start_codon:yes stop_codon:yes gene_type:complete
MRESRVDDSLDLLEFGIENHGGNQSDPPICDAS